jgi:hypothetical protein
VPKLLYSFGREDQLDKGADRRLVASLSRLLDPSDALAANPGVSRPGHLPAAGQVTLQSRRPSKCETSEAIAAGSKTRPSSLVRLDKITMAG